jgi:uncharacterized protein (DUF2062 family)
MRTVKSHIERLTAALFRERLDPARAAAAVFLGIFIGIVPIYGFQLLTAIGLALLFKLNKPLTVAATFINNPFLQPLIVIASVDIGYFLRHGHFHPFKLSALTGSHLKDELLSWFLGSLVLGIIVGGVGAIVTAIIVHLRSPANSRLREHIRFTERIFAESSIFDRSFVWWKLRLDRIFAMLTAEDLGSGAVVDLGCGYGIALALASNENANRPLAGCDLNGRRIATARRSLSSLDAAVSVHDIRSFPLPPAGLILILDVLQYLPAEDQMILLKRCCSALLPDGKLIFRIHDRERGLWSRVTLALDRLLFLFERTGTSPMTLSASDYQHVLEAAGMQIETRHFLNRLPLAHILFVAKKPGEETAR